PYLREVALEAGARDAADLVFPLHDERPNIGNALSLPMFGLDDDDPHTRLHVPARRVFRPGKGAGNQNRWIAAADQVLALREMRDRPSPANAIPAKPGAANSGPR